jgi:hypothetical protein
MDQLFVGACIMRGSGLDGQGSVSSRGKIFLFFTVSRVALGPTQPPIQRIPEVLSPGVKWLGFEADHSPPPNADVMSGVAILLPPPALHMSLWHGA